jgi:hypothetical protein
VHKLMPENSPADRLGIACPNLSVSIRFAWHR